MDLVPQRNIDDVVIDSEPIEVIREQLNKDISDFLAKGGKIQVIESGVRCEKVPGKYTGVTEMEDGTFRVTLNGFLVGDGYYTTREKATATLLKYQFKDGRIYD